MFFQYPSFEGLTEINKIWYKRIKKLRPDTDKR